MKNLGFCEWFEKDLLFEMALAEDWLRQLLMRAKESPQEYKRLNATYLLDKPEEFEKLMTKFYDILRFETNLEVLKSKMSKLLAKELQRDMGFGTNTQSLNRSPESEHPVGIPYRRPVFGWPGERFGAGSTHRPEDREKIAQAMRDSHARRKAERLAQQARFAWQPGMRFPESKLIGDKYA